MITTNIRYEEVPAWLQSVLAKAWWQKGAEKLDMDGPITQEWVDDMSLLAQSMLLDDTSEYYRNMYPP